MSTRVRCSAEGVSNLGGAGARYDSSRPEDYSTFFDSSVRCSPVANRLKESPNHGRPRKMQSPLTRRCPAGTCVLPQADASPAISPAASAPRSVDASPAFPRCSRRTSLPAASSSQPSEEPLQRRASLPADVVSRQRMPFPSEKGPANQGARQPPEALHSILKAASRRVEEALPHVPLRNGRGVRISSVPGKSVCWADGTVSPARTRWYRGQWCMPEDLPVVRVGTMWW